MGVDCANSCPGPDASSSEVRAAGLLADSVLPFFEASGEGVDFLVGVEKSRERSSRDVSCRGSWVERRCSGRHAAACWLFLRRLLAALCTSTVLDESARERPVDFATLADLLGASSVGSFSSGTEMMLLRLLLLSTLVRRMMPDPRLLRLERFSTGGGGGEPGTESMERLVPVLEGDLGVNESFSSYFKLGLQPSLKLTQIAVIVMISRNWSLVSFLCEPSSSSSTSSRILSFAGELNGVRAAGSGTL